MDNIPLNRSNSSQQLHQQAISQSPGPSQLYSPHLPKAHASDPSVLTPAALASVVVVRELGGQEAWEVLEKAV